MNPIDEQYFFDLATKYIAKRANANERQEFEDILKQSAEHRERFELFKTDLIVAKDIVSLLDATDATGAGLNETQLERLKREVEALSKKTKTHWWHGFTAIALLVLATVILSYFIFHKPYNPPGPDITTSWGLWVKMVQPLNSDAKDFQAMPVYQTEIGKQVWGWLMKQNWFKGKGVGQILEPRNNGSRHELVLIYENPAGNEKISVIFFPEDGMLKFHDIFLIDMKGYRVDMFLSQIIRNPSLAEKAFNKAHPEANGRLFEIINRL